MDAMDQAVYKDDVQHIIIDNLQFMMPDSLYSTSAPTEDGPQGKQKSSRHSSSFEKFDYMDGVVNRLRKFATEKNVSRESWFRCTIQLSSTMLNLHG